MPCSGFMIPAALLLKYMTKRSFKCRVQRCAAVFVFLLGLGLFLNVFVGVYLSLTRPQPSATPAAPEQGGGGAAGREEAAGGGAMAAAWLRGWVSRGAARAASAGSDGSLTEVLRWAGWGA